MTPCCPPGLCDFRVAKVRQILALLDVAKVTRLDPVELARTVLNPRGERTIGRVGIDIENPEEDAALMVIAVQQALKGAEPNITASQLARRICPHAVPEVNPNDDAGPETRRDHVDMPSHNDRRVCP